MQDLRPSIFAIRVNTTTSTATPTSTSPMAIRMVAVMKSQQDLREVVPYCIFGYRAVVFERLMDYGGQVATTAVLHEDVKDTSVSIDVAVVVSDYVVVM